MSDEREMDVRIATEVMGWTLLESPIEKGQLCYRDHYGLQDLPNFGEDDAEALQALKQICKKFPGLRYTLEGGRGAGADCTLCFHEPRMDYTPYGRSNAPSVSLAICWAIIALLDRDAKHKKESTNG